MFTMTSSIVMCTLVRSCSVGAHLVGVGSRFFSLLQLPALGQEVRAAAGMKALSLLLVCKRRLWRLWARGLHHWCTDGVLPHTAVERPAWRL